MNKIWITGDLHGRFQPVREFCESGRINATNTNYLIILGDFGGNYFFNYRDDDFKEKLLKYSEKYNLTYFVIRGNHEERPANCAAKNPNDWHLDIFWNNLVWFEKNILLLNMLSMNQLFMILKVKRLLCFQELIRQTKTID